MEGSAAQAGFYYQNNVAALKIIECLFFDSDITHIELENYDKMHLFSVDLSRHKSNTVIDEGIVYQCGHEAKLLNLKKDWKIGLGICFDLRFPELYRHYFSQGANIMTVASAFTVPTGKAHWETLVKARAIENQSYVAGVNRSGKDGNDIAYSGDSALIDFMGKKVLEAGAQPKLLAYSLEWEPMRAYREKFPAWQDGDEYEMFA